MYNFILSLMKTIFKKLKNICFNIRSSLHIILIKEKTKHIKPYIFKYFSKSCKNIIKFYNVYKTLLEFIDL